MIFCWCLPWAGPAALQAGAGLLQADTHSKVCGHQISEWLTVPIPSPRYDDNPHFVLSLVCSLC